MTSLGPQHPLDEAAARRALERVVDPEIPVLTVFDLGIIRGVWVEADCVEVAITPTYSGCPAMHVIEQEIGGALTEAGFRQVRVRTAIAPPWTTDWLTDEGRAKLQAIGIVPPTKVSASKRALLGEEAPVTCPRCRATTTTMLSPFGSTACKAIWRCDSCLETFDQFKCI